MRYAGQAYEIAVASDGLTVPAITRAFHEAHRARYGHAVLDQEVEVVGYRLVAVAPSPLRTIRSAPARDRVSTPPAAGYQVRHELEPGVTMAGPCVIEEPTATTYVPDGWTLRIDPIGNLILEAA